MRREFCWGVELALMKFGRAGGIFYPGSAERRWSLIPTFTKDKGAGGVGLWGGGWNS